jgi:hypothetical protein
VTRIHRSLTWVSGAATVFGLVATVVMTATHDPDHGADIGAGIGLIGSTASGIAWSLSLYTRRVETPVTRRILLAVAMASLVFGFLLLSLMRPFDA